ncbi:coiled-coil protein, partial [Legionella sainthelensi]
NGKPFTGNDGQSNLLKSLQHFIAQMSELGEKQKEKEYRKSVRRLTETLHQMERNASQIADKINHLLVNNLSEEDAIQLTLIKDEIEKLDKAIQERSNFIMDHLGHDVEVYEELTEMIKQDEAEIQSLIEMQNMIYDSVSQQLHGKDLQTYHNLREDLDELNEHIPELSAGVGKMIQHHMELIAADTKLKQAINLAKATHEQHFAKETPFS